MTKIATFNANSIRARMPILLEWLEQHQPDILGIQETKVIDEDFPKAEIEAAGYHVQFKGQKSYNGVAVLSKEPAEVLQVGFDDGEEHADETRLMAVKVGDVHLVNTYIPQGREIDHPMFPYKCRWFERLRAFFDKHYTTSDKLVWVGDTNVAHDPIDVYNPEKRAGHVCYHDDARKAFAACREWGFVDVFRKFHPEGGHYTFFDYRTINSAKRGMGWRIDYILTSPSMADLCVDSYIDVEPRLKPKPSDHTFLVAEFDL